jgi:AcrR family transcriptional regulator
MNCAADVVVWATACYQSTMAGRRKPRGEYHHGDLKTALIETALTIAEDSGVDAISTRELTRRLGVSHAAPARHFASRDALLAEVAAAAFDRFGHALARAAASATGRDVLPAIGRAYVRFALDHPALLRLMFRREVSELAETPPRLQEAQDRAFAALVSGVRTLLGAHASDDRVSQAAFAAWAMAHGAVTLWLDGPIRKLLPARGGRAAFLADVDRAFEIAARTVANM